MPYVTQASEPLSDLISQYSDITPLNQASEPLNGLISQYSTHHAAESSERAAEPSERQFNELSFSYVIIHHAAESSERAAEPIMFFNQAHAAEPSERISLRPLRPTSSLSHF